MGERDLTNLNIYCEDCKIPMIYSHTSLGKYYYKCPGCGKKKIAIESYGQIKIK